MLIIIISRNVLSASEPAFKPRKVKKDKGKGKDKEKETLAEAEAAASYRDRAAERRGGEDTDYAQVRISVNPNVTRLTLH
jgi:hypothetical protein